MATSNYNSSFRGPTDHETARSSKTVTFYINGDRNFHGHVMVITSRRFRSVDILLLELGNLRYFKDLPLGVRYLFALETGSKIDNLDQLIDGKAYVCSSHSRLKKISYGGRQRQSFWGARQQFELPNIHEMESNETRRRHLGVNRSSEHSEHRGKSDTHAAASVSRVNKKPKIVTVIRNGPHKPRTVVKTLLNKRTAQKLEQVLDEVASAFGNTGGLSPPRKLFTVTGQHIRDVAELFRDENNVFIAVGKEKFSPEEISDILEDLEQNASSKRQTKHKQPKASNEGMSYGKQRKDKELEQSKSLATAGENKLPKLPDIHTKVESQPQQEITIKPHAQIASTTKHTRVSHDKGAKVRANELRNPERKRQAGLKLPQISGNNLVSKAEKENQENTEISKPSDEGNNSVFGTNAAHSQVMGSKNTSDGHGGKGKQRKKDSVSKNQTSSSNKTLTKSSRDDSGIVAEDDVKYGTVTDKNVEDVYHMGKKIGDGNFADVRECVDKITKKEFALKIVDKNKIRGKEQMIKDEIEIMRRCKHPNIVQMYEDYDTPRNIYLVMELIKGGDLFDAISSSVKFTEDVTRSYVKDIAKSLAYLHRRKIVHRDLKPENLLVHKKPNGQTILKLADFGLAMEVKTPIFTVCGTPTYVAPEILEETGYGLKVDMWAAGVITYIMLCGFPPFRSAKRDQDELFDLIMEGDYEFLSPYWDHISEGAKDLISKLLVVNPNERHSAEDVLVHRWIKSASNSELGEDEFLGRKITTRRTFKAAALAVQGAKRFESLAEQFKHQRGEKVIVR